MGPDCEFAHGREELQKAGWIFFKGACMSSEVTRDEGRSAGDSVKHLQQRVSYGSCNLEIKKEASLTVGKSER